jgi:hypothetical protein
MATSEKSSVMGWLAKSFKLGTRRPRPAQSTGEKDGRASPPPLLKFETSHISDHDSSYEGMPSSAIMAGNMRMEQPSRMDGSHGSAPELLRRSPPRQTRTIRPSPGQTVKGQNDPLQGEGKKDNGAERPLSVGGQRQQEHGHMVSSNESLNATFSRLSKN